MGRTASTRDYLADAGRGVKLEEQTTEDNTVLKYKSSDGSNRYVSTSNTPGGGGGSSGDIICVRINTVHNESGPGDHYVADKNASDVIRAIREENKGVVYVYSMIPNGYTFRITSQVIIDFNENKIGVIFPGEWLEGEMIEQYVFTHTGFEATKGYEQ